MNPFPGSACFRCPSISYAASNRLTCNCPPGFFLNNPTSLQQLECLECPRGARFVCFFCRCMILFPSLCLFLISVCNL
jgi:hypothetical protein